MRAFAKPGTINAAAPTVGVYGEAKNSTTSNYGIHGRALVTPPAGPDNFAGYFNGDGFLSAGKYRSCL